MASEIEKLSGYLSVNEMKKLGFPKDEIKQYAQRRIWASTDEVIAAEETQGTLLHKIK